jgi:hypothetical protein
LTTFSLPLKFYNFDSLGLVVPDLSSLHAAPPAGPTLARHGLVPAAYEALFTPRLLSIMHGITAQHASATAAVAARPRTTTIDRTRP